MKKLREKDRIELIITVVLVIVFIVFSATLLRKIRVSQPVLRSAGEKLFFRASNFQYDPQRNKGTSFLLEKSAREKISEAKRDPFSFGSPLNGRLIDLSLKGIIWNSDKPSAVINGRVLNIGDGISEFKVIQILQDRVILENEKSKLELKLNR